MTPRNDDYEGMIARSLLGTASPEERQELDDRLRVSPEDSAHYNRLLKSRGFSQTVKIYRNLDEKAAFRAFRQRTGARIIPFQRVLKYAAVLILPLALAAGFLLFQPDKTTMLQPNMAMQQLGESSRTRCLLNTGKQVLSLVSTTPHRISTGFDLEASNTTQGLNYEEFSLVKNVQYHELITPAGAEYTVRLADGTVVHLNACSRLRFPTAFNGATRDVELNGEAFFQVAKCKNAPFLIHTNNLIIKQYGTKFNVNTFDPNLVQVALVEGRIGLIHKQKETLLKSNQLGTFHTQTGTTDVCETDLSPYVSWNQGQFVFENESLEKMMATISRWYNLTVRFNSSQAASYRFTGSLSRNTPMHDLLDIIRYSTDVQIRIQGQNVLISK